jgi:hypothetical protein
MLKSNLALEDKGHCFKQYFRLFNILHEARSNKKNDILYKWIG